MKKAIMLSFVLFISALLFAQDSKVVETEFKVFGNCGMCKTRIENVLKIQEVKLAKWDKQSKLVKVAYIEDAVTVDSLMKRVAAVGHDTEKFKAPNDVYAKLPKCCLYRDNNNTH